MGSCVLVFKCNYCYAIFAGVRVEDRAGYSYFTTWPRTSQGSPTFLRRYSEIQGELDLEIWLHHYTAKYIKLWYVLPQLTWRLCRVEWTVYLYLTECPDIPSPHLSPMEFQWQVAAPDRLSLAVIINHPKYFQTKQQIISLPPNRVKVRSSYHSQTWSEILLLW